jgi:glycosyltransferase involved in cell wall biosynthesis
MEIAFFSESYLPTRDGVSTVVSGLARALHRAGHSVRVYTPNPVKGAAPEHLDVDGSSVIRARSVPVPLYGEYRWAVFPFAQLRGERFREDVDIIHLHTPGIMGSTAFLSARYFDKPLVGTFHTNVWAMRESFPSTPLVQMFFRAAWWYSLGTYWRCDVTTAPTALALDQLVRATRKPFRHAPEVIPNGIEVDRFHPGIREPDWRTRCGLPNGPLVTYLGRLTQDKGVHRFLDAVSAVSEKADFSAVVAGKGPEECRVRERLESDPVLARRVRFLGPVAEEEKPALLAQSDIFVLPSTSDTSSIALLEAMACGAACIASDEGGPREIITPGVTGRLFSVRDPEALPSTLAELLDRPAERARYANAATAFVRESASIDATARRFISLYEHLIAGRSDRAARIRGRPSGGGPKGGPPVP